MMKEISLKNNLFLPAIILLCIQLSSCTSAYRYSNSVVFLKEINISVKDTISLETTEGRASWYGKKHHGKKTANGEIFNMYDFTASHNTYPFGTYLRVTSLSTFRTIVVKINDRMSKRNKRIIDLSYAAAKALGMIKSGTSKVKIDVLKWGK